MANAANIPRKQPKQARSHATYEAILQASTRILEREGRAQLSTNRIAEVAGVSVGSFYQYFPHKEAVLAELRRRYDQQFTQRMVRELGQLGRSSLREAVPEFVRFMIGLHIESPKLHNELSADIPASQHETLRAFVLAYLEGRRSEVRRKDLDLATAVAMEAGEALVHRTALHEPERLRDERFVEEVCDLLLRYLAN